MGNRVLSYTLATASLALRHVGTSMPAIQCMLTTLLNLCDYTCTSFGDSVTYFDSNDGSGIPIHVVAKRALLWGSQGFISMLSDSALAPEKSHWYMINFDWFWLSYCSIHHDDPPLTVMDKDDNQVEIKCVPIHEGCCTITIRIAPDGNMDDEVKYSLSESTLLWA